MNIFFTKTQAQEQFGGCFFPYHSIIVLVGIPANRKM